MQNDVRIFMEACGQYVQAYGEPIYPPVGRFNVPEIHDHLARDRQVDLYM